jgi:hypothetical protein
VPDENFRAGGSRRGNVKHDDECHARPHGRFSLQPDLVADFRAVKGGRPANGVTDHVSIKSM